MASSIQKPDKPYHDFPLFAHRNGQWAKKIKGRLCYFGPWDDPDRAMKKYTQKYGSAAGNSPSKIKPPKPYPDFPLFPHQNGQWAKTIRGRMHYFGTWDDPQSAVDRYNRQRDDLQAGRKPRVESDGITVKMLVTKFLNSKRRLVENGELSHQMHHDYKVVCTEIIEHFGRTTAVTAIRSEDFASFRTSLAKTRGPVTLKNWIIRARSVFKFACTERLIKEPVHYGNSFSIPSAKMLRQARNAKPERLFEAPELRIVLDRLNRKVSRNLRAMVLLGINCGFGVTDCALLPFNRLDIEQGWHDFPRPKTGVIRVAKLWPETIKALQYSIEYRKAPVNEEDSDKVFITSQGNCYRGKKLNDKNPISQRFSAILRELGIKHDGLNFGALRHTLQTIGEGALDKVALQHMMGHAPDNKDMGAVYREKIFRERLIKVSDYVHNWLYGSGK